MPTTPTFASNGVDVPFEFYAPVSTKTSPGFVAIAYGTDGLSEPWGTQIRAYATALSSQGFAVMIPDYFVCTGTSAGAGAFERISVYRDVWQKAIADAVNHAKLKLATDPGRVGLLGFSLGGHLCVRQRAAAKVLIEYFAPELDGLGDAGGTTKQCQIHHGQADNIVPMSPNANNVSQLLRSEGAAVEMYSYPGASHGFIGSDASNADARANSFRRTVECFTKFL